MVTRMLVINIGSTSTKVAYYEDLSEVHANNLKHATDVIVKPLYEQLDARLEAIDGFLESNGIPVQSIDAIGARGGLLKAIEGGTYKVNERMLEDLKDYRYGKHASNLSALIADEYTKEYGIPAFITDPVVVDELMDEVRMTGLKDIERVSIFHALNQKAIARKFAGDTGRTYEGVNVIVIHMGGGITVGSHKEGRVVDVNEGLSGDGPMSPTRTGSLPNNALAKYIIDNDLSYDTIYNTLTKEGGFISLAGTEDALALEKRALDGEDDALSIYQSLAVQIAKEIGSRAAVLKGDVDGILFTGGLAYSNYLIDLIRPYVEFISKISVYPGEREMQALAEGTLRVITQKEHGKTYE